MRSERVRRVSAVNFCKHCPRGLLQVIHDADLNDRVDSSADMDIGMFESSRILRDASVI